MPRPLELSFARLSNSGTTIQTDSPSRAAPPIEYIHICKATATADAFLMPCGHSAVTIKCSFPKTGAGHTGAMRCDAPHSPHLLTPIHADPNHDLAHWSAKVGRPAPRTSGLPPAHPSPPSLSPSFPRSLSPSAPPSPHLPISFHILPFPSPLAGRAHISCSDDARCHPKGQSRKVELPSHGCLMP